MNNQMADINLLEVKDLCKNYYYKNHEIKAIKDINLSVCNREILGLAGESGSGKSTLARLIMNIEKPTSGNVYFEGKCISDKAIYRKNRNYICKSMQLLFQNSDAALNPRLKIGDIISEPLKIQKLYLNKSEINFKVEEVLDIVGLDRSFIDKYSFECSGGEKQRICISRAIITSPKFIIADEPITSLDIISQLKSTTLFKQIVDVLGVSIIFISHYLSMLGKIADRVAIIKSGSLVELNTSKEIFDNPKSEYTKELLSSIPCI